MDVKMNKKLMEDVANVMRLLYSRGLVQVRGGNASIYDPSENLIYISPSGMPRHLITSEDIAVIDLNGRVIRGIPSSEWRMHMMIYKRIKCARGIVHAHGPWSIVLGESGEEPKLDLTTEARERIRCVSVVPKIKPGSLELANVVSKTFEETQCNVAILRGHGSISYSCKSIYHALEVVEALEDLAKVQILLRLLATLS